MSKINPTFFLDMQRVFQTERSKADSERYIEKIKKCEDSIIKAPTSDKDVESQLRYETTRMIVYQKMLKYRKSAKSLSKTIYGRIKSLFQKKIN